MEFNKETFEKALKANKIVRYQQHFEAVVKSYLEIENQSFRQPPVSGRSEQLVCDENELDCPYEFTSRCTMGRCDCKPKQTNYR